MRDDELILAKMLDFCDEHGIYETAVLDETVYDLVSTLAQQVNNSGTEAQLDFILKELGVTGAWLVIKALAEERDDGATESG